MFAGTIAVPMKRKNGTTTALQDVIGMAGTIERGSRAGSVGGRYRVVLVLSGSSSW
jgi:hypothetical protein